MQEAIKIDCPETVGGFKVNWIHLKEYDLNINPVNTTEATGSRKQYSRKYDIRKWRS